MLGKLLSASFPSAMYNLSPNVTDTAVSAGNCTLEASAPGIYVLTIGNKAVKVVLR